MAELGVASVDASRSDADAYAAAPPDPGEFTADDASLAWEGKGWEEFYERRGHGTPPGSPPPVETDG